MGDGDEGEIGRVFGEGGEMTTEEMSKLDHILDGTIRDDIQDTLTEIEEYETEIQVLKLNPQRNRMDIYMKEGKILERKDFIETLENILLYRINRGDYI